MENCQSFHPLYSLALHRAARVAHRKGTIDTEGYDSVCDAIAHPVRKDKDGNECDIVEEARKHTIKSYCSQFNGDERIKMEAEMNKVGFDWGGIWQWIKDHLPQILQVISILLTIFMFI